jgi:hypothetical protein
MTYMFGGYGKQGGEARLDELTRLEHVNFTLRSESV